MTLRIAFFDPYSPQNSKYDGKAKPPYRFFGMASQARARGAETLIVEKGSKSVFDAIRQIQVFKPDVVGISTYFNSVCHRQALEVAATFRGKAKIIIGGYDASTNPLVIEEFEPDYLVKGEGELPVGAMVEANFDPEKIDSETVKVTKDGKTYIVEAQQAFDLDLLPLPQEIKGSYHAK